jgi:mannosyltransferase
VTRAEPQPTDPPSIAPAPTERGDGDGSQPFLREYAVPVGLAVAMLVMGLFRLGSKAVWQDEAFTWSSATLSDSKFAANLIHHEASLGLFLVLERIWMWFGTGAFWIRLLSVLFATATIPILWVLARRLANARTATIATLLFVVNATWLSHVQEARVYPLAVMLGCLSTYWFVREMDEPSRRNRWWWVIASVLLVLAHVITALVIVAQVLSVLVARRDPQRRRHVVGGIGMMAWVLVPFGLLTLFQPVYSHTDVRPSVHFLFVTVRDLVGRGSLLLGLELLAACTGLALIVRAWSARRESDDAWRIALPTLWIGFSTVAFFLYGQLTPAAFQERYMLAFLPGFVILVAMGIGRMPNRWLQVGAVVVLLALAARGVDDWYDGEPREAWRSVAHTLERDAHPGDAIVFEADLSRLPVAYELRDQPATERKLTPAWPGGRPWTSGFTSDDYRFDTITPPTMARIAADHDRVWAVDVGVHDANTRAAIRTLERTHREVRDLRFDAKTRLLLYERR